jgi:hypothetical protein
MLNHLSYFSYIEKYLHIFPTFFKFIVKKSGVCMIDVKRDWRIKRGNERKERKKERRQQFAPHGKTGILVQQHQQSTIDHAMVVLFCRCKKKKSCDTLYSIPLDFLPDHHYFNLKT